MRFALLPAGIAGDVAAQPAGERVEPAEPPTLPTDDELATYLADPSTTAEQAYRIGARMFDAQRYEAAEKAWLRAHSLGRDPKLLVAVANTRQRRIDAPGAVGMLEQSIW